MDTWPALIRALCFALLRLLLIGIAANGPALALSAEAAGGGAERGGLIYTGDVALAARIRGQQDRLPVEASRCINCHAIGNGSIAFAPPLTPASLQVPQPRRGGPESSYDLATFCHALRTGVDPMEIVLSRAMPQFDASDDDCAALWTFFTRP